MKDCIVCQCCSDCGMLVPLGFNSRPRYYCTRFTMYVEPDDGCTFGCEGRPMQATDGVDATVYGQSATGGGDAY